MSQQDPASAPNAAGGTGAATAAPSAGSAAAPAGPLTPAERRLTLLMGAVQFVSILCFMIMMPLGPDFTMDLGIDPAKVGWIMAAYTAASALSGLFAALVLDRFDRRTALAFVMTGLVLSTVAAGLAVDLTTLLAARVVAGCFGGPAAALAIAIVADNVPPERRGQAMGTVMGSLSVAAVAGVPLGLELSRLGGWRFTFFAVAAVGLVIVAVATLLLPPQRGHLRDLPDGPPSMADAAARLLRVVKRPLAQLALALSAVAIVPGFLVITNLAVFVQFNLGFPREQLGLLYMAGGGLSFFGMRLAGKAVDRFGATPVTTLTTLSLAVVLYLLFYDRAWLALPVLLLVPAFMLFNTARMVAQSTTVSKVPGPEERAGFMAVTNSVTQASSGVGALLGTVILTTAPDGRLEHVSTLAALGIGIALLGPPLMWALERRLPGTAAVSHRVRAMHKTGAPQT